MNPHLPRLMLVVESTRSALPVADLFAAAVEGGCDAIQLRDRHAPDQDRRRQVATALEIAGNRAQVIVNRDVDLAVEFSVGIHLPERDARPSAVRTIVGDGVLIGKSVHSIDSVAMADGADYLIAGHVYPTPSHQDGTPLGPAGFARIVAVSKVPVLAIGGITADRVDEVVGAGASGVAVIGAISAAPTREAATQAARDLRRALDLGLRRSSR